MLLMIEFIEFYFYFCDRKFALNSAHIAEKFNLICVRPSEIYSKWFQYIWQVFWDEFS